MPGPAIKPTQLPWWADPQQTSVMDPLWVQVARRTASLTGLDDPQSAVMQGATGTPLVAGVKPELIPALRRRGELLLQQILKNGLPGYDPRRNVGTLAKAPIFEDVLKFAQEKYPRLFGHILDIGEITPMQNLAMSAKISPGNIAFTKGLTSPFGDENVNALLGAHNVTRPSKFSAIDITQESPLHFIMPHPDQADMARTFGHELTHAADALVDRNAMEKYKFAQGLPGGYVANSAEIRANMQGDRFLKKFLEWKAKNNGQPGK